MSYICNGHCRGKRSLETICLTLAYKIKYPENVFLLRGNHECASINRFVWLDSHMCSQLYSSYFLYFAMKGIRAV